MKKYFLQFIAIVMLFVACQSKTQKPESIISDTVVSMPADSPLIDSTNHDTTDISMLQQNNQPQTPPGMVIGKANSAQSMSFDAKGSEERRKGVDLAIKGDLNGAVEMFTKAIQISDRNPEGYYLRGKAKRELRNFTGAESDMSKAIKLRKQASYYFARGQLYMDWRKYKEANADFDSTLMKDPENLDAMNFKGVALAQLGKHNDAIEIYDRVLEKNPGSALTYYNKGTSLAALSRFQESEETFTKAISINPNYEQAFVNRGNSRLMQNKYQESWDDYSTALTFNPDNKDALYNSGFALKQLKNISQACENWRKAVAAGHPLAQQQLEKYCK